MSTKRFAALILLERPESPPLDALLESLNQRHPPLEARTAEAKEGTVPDGAYLARIGGAPVMVVAREGRVPEGSLDRSIKTSITWPEAASAVEKHTAHVIVTTLVDVTPETAQSLATITAAAAAGVAERTPALGVYWLSADLLVAPEPFIDGAWHGLQGRPPVARWIKFMSVRGRAEEGETAPIGFITHGFNVFAGREVEMTPRVAEGRVVAAQAAGFMRQLIRRPMEIESGQKIQVGESERLVVELRDDNPFTKAPVFVIRPEEGASAAAPPAAAVEPETAPEVEPALDAAAAADDAAAFAGAAVSPAAEAAVGAAQVETQAAPSPVEPASLAAEPPAASEPEPASAEKPKGVFGRLFGKR